MNRWLAVFGLLACANAQAWECRYDKEIDSVLDVSASSMLEVAAGAGDLRIAGQRGADEVSIRGRVCVSEEEWLDDVRLDLESGERARIGVVTPDTDGWNIMGSRYATVDLELIVPDSLDLDVSDSSGDMDIENVAAVRIRDSSGDIEVRDVRGTVEIEDSSGSIDVSDVGGDLVIHSDSSGEIDGEDIEGSVLVERDSSGDMYFSRVGRDVTIEKDSSGDIRVDDVKGDFTVVRDSSGSINSKDVAGETRIPDHKRS